MGKIVVTGLGIVSALGIGKDSTLQQLRAGKSSIAAIKHLDTKHKDIPVGEVPYNSSELKDLLGIHDTRLINRSTLLGRIALREALQEARLLGNAEEHAAFISGNTVGGMDISEKYYHDFLNNHSHDEYILQHDCGACTDMISAEYAGRFKMMTTISTACSSAANAIILGANLIQSGQIDIAVVGGTESLSKFHLNGFNALMILDAAPCKPFDAERNGLNLGEGAAYLVIETEESARKRQADILCELSGYGNSCDAFHQTATSPNGDGPYLAMRKALQSSGLQPKDIDYINAHGTGTGNNDECEGIAMMRIFGEQMPPVSSTKSYTGHTTSAAGSVESVISILALRNHFIPANLRYQKPIDGHRFAPVATVKENVPLRHVLTNSFGFGGNDSSCIFSIFETQNNHNQNITPKQEIYIQAVSQISLQEPLCENWFEQPVIPEKAFNPSQEPNYGAYFTPMAARRMGRLFKRAIATAVDVLQKAHIDQVDAIISGTGLGSVENTEKVLNAMLDNDEECLSPTAFMQSTHNTIASQMAMHLKCHGYNSTYAHRGTSFDYSLLDAVTQIQKGDISNALVGAHEEMSQDYFNMLQKVGFFTFDDISENTLRQHQNKGSLSGECSVNMLISSQAKDSLCKLDFCGIFYQASLSELHHVICQKLQELHLGLHDIDAIVTGLDGDQANDSIYMDFAEQCCPDIPIVWYKHLFGKSYCASAFGLYVGTTCLQRQQIPAHILYNRNQAIAHPHHILVFNQFENKDQSLILLSC